MGAVDGIATVAAPGLGRTGRYTPSELLAINRQLVAHAEGRRGCMALIDPPEGMLPGELVSWRGASWARTRATASPMICRPCCAASRNCFPSGVSSTPRGLRRNSAQPSRCSICLISRLTADWVTPSAWAAAVKPPRSPAATTASRDESDGRSPLT